MMFRTIVRPLTVALSLAFALTAAAPAFADGNGKAKTAENHRDGKAKGKAGKVKLSFPIEAAKFSKHVEAQLTKAKERLTEAMKTNKVAADKQTTVLKEFEAGATLVREAAKKAATDGTVSADEAKQVRTLMKALHKEGQAHKTAKKDKAAAKGA